MNSSPSLITSSSSCDATVAACALDALLDWGDVEETAQQPSFTSEPELLAAHMVRIAGLAGKSATIATRERNTVVAAAWTAHGERLGWEWVGRSDELAVGVDASTAVAHSEPERPAVARWVVVATEALPTTVLALGGPGEGGLVWRLAAAALPTGLPRRPLIGLAGLNLIDLGELPERHAITLAAADVPAAARPLADLLDGAVDLGLAMGFVQRVADYLSERLLAQGEPASEVEPAVLQQLGSAYAELGVVSEGLREAVVAAPGDRAVAAACQRRNSAHRLAALLSDLFESTGASATSERYGLDRPWRDFITRQAVFPAGGDPRAGAR
jgi:hypothetical protein